MRRTPPTLGQHNSEVLTELCGLTDAELDRLAAAERHRHPPEGSVRETALVLLPRGFYGGVVSQIADRVAESSPWSPRETELLAVTLRLLQQHRYEGLTVEAVAATARASKATVYRRWPSKAELVLAAFIEGVRRVVVAA